MTLRSSRRNYSCVGFISNTIFAYEATSQGFFRVFRYAGLVGVYKSQQPTAPVCHIKSPAQTIFTSTGWLFRLRDGHHRRIPARIVRRSGNGRGRPPRLARIPSSAPASSPTSPPNSPTSAPPSSGQLTLQNTSPAADPRSVCKTARCHCQSQWRPPPESDGQWIKAERVPYTALSPLPN